MSEPYDPGIDHEVGKALRFDEDDGSDSTGGQIRLSPQEEALLAAVLADPGEVVPLALITDERE